MIAFINAMTGTEMLVADDRKDEYLAAGHKLAVSSSVNAKEAETVAEEPKEQPKKAAPKKAPVRKTATKKK